MKKHLKFIVMLALALTLCATVSNALAADVRYASKSSVKVYSEMDTSSKVLKKLKGASKVLIEEDYGSWVMILVEDTKHGGQKAGYVQSKNLSYDFPQSQCSHEWGKWQITKEATCTKKGSRYRLCNKCGIRDEQTIKATGHEWGKWKVTKEATCAREGTRTRTCKVCGEKQKETYYADHTYGSWSMTQQPTCTAQGKRERTCKVCGHVEKQTLDTVPHEYAYKIVKEVTDHSAGIRAKVCAVCGKTTGEESFDPEGTLRRGSRGEAVAHMQQLLVEQGYLNAGGADGVFGGGSEKALAKYQQDRNLNPDGIGWPQTLQDLEHDYGPWETVRKMTRTEAGERVRVCRGCGFEQRETIESGEVFENGRRGEDVRALQQMLTELGYNAGGYDGIYGRKLDAAMAGFAASHGIVVETGKVRPSDVDAVMNAWLDSLKPEDWKGEGGVSSPVNLALTVTPNGETDDSGIRSYRWTLTNLGSQKVTYLALFLTFGDDPDFKQENLVMNLDGVALKPNAGNSASGSFNADSDWGEGSLSFAALAVSERDGAKWLSNAVTFENANHPAEKTIAPLPVDLDVYHLPDGNYPVAFNRGDVFSGTSGIYMNGVQIFTQDRYDPEEIANLKAGDTIVVEGEAVPVLSVQETEYGYLINGDQDDHSFYLSAGEDFEGFVVHGLDDMSVYTDHGMTALMIDPAAVFIDDSDIESDPVNVSGVEIVEAMQTTDNVYFVPYNTSVRVENNRVTEIHRIYVP